MTGYKANFALKNSCGTYYYFKETTDKQQIKALKKALNKGFNQLILY